MLLHAGDYTFTEGGAVWPNEGEMEWPLEDGLPSGALSPCAAYNSRDLLDAFAGQLPWGEWKLRVQSAGYTGALEGWSIAVEVAQAEAPPPSVTSTLGGCGAHQPLA